MADMPPVTAPTALLDRAAQDYAAHHRDQDGRCAACRHPFPCWPHRDLRIVLVQSGRELPDKPGAPGVTFRTCDG